MILGMLFSKDSLKGETFPCTYKESPNSFYKRCRKTQYASPHTLAPWLGDHQPDSPIMKGETLFEQPIFLKD